MFGLTRERTRQIEEAAIRKLSTLAEAQGLRDAAYLGARLGRSAARSVIGRAPDHAVALDWRAVPVKTDAIGKTYPAFEYEVGKEKIREYARAVGEDNPVYFDREQAKAAGFRDVPAPPMFAVVYSAGVGGPGASSTPRWGSTSR